MIYVVFIVFAVIVIFIINIHYCPVKAGKSVFEIVET